MTDIIDKIMIPYKYPEHELFMEAIETLPSTNKHTINSIVVADYELQLGHYPADFESNDNIAPEDQIYVDMQDKE